MESLDRYSHLSTSTIFDAMERLGLTWRGGEPIRPLAAGDRLIGFALTVRFVPVEEAGASALEGDYLDEVQPGHVVVNANGGRTDCCVWGGRRSMKAIARGARGIVVDGLTRDADEHPVLGFPVLARGATMVTSRNVVAPVEVNVGVTIGEDVIHGGDLVVGDGDGFIRVPSDSVTAVLEEAEALDRAERAAVADEIAGLARGGRNLLQAWSLVKDTR